jgi:hypothetical protein
MLKLGGRFILRPPFFMDPNLSSFDRQFLSLDKRARILLTSIDESRLFEQPRSLPKSWALFSCGEYLLRSAAMVEKTFGGITTRLWDDPFEWTLPEKLSTRSRVLEYLDEVESTRTKGFTYFTSDEDLKREIPAPERLRTIFDILLDSVTTASHYQGRAFAAFQMVSDEKLPRL